MLQMCRQLGFVVVPEPDLAIMLVGKRLAEN
jgi:hypothetical protein